MSPVNDQLDIYEIGGLDQRLHDLASLFGAALLRLHQRQALLPDNSANFQQNQLAISCDSVMNVTQQLTHQDRQE